MNKRINFLLVVMFLFVCGVAIADQAVLAQRASGNEWEIGPEIYYMDYREPAFEVENEGVMYGVAGSFAHHNAARWMVKADGHAAVGAVDYSSAGSGTASDIVDYTVEGRVSVGYEYELQAGWTMTPYFGIGYRYLNDDSAGVVTSMGHGGYERESNYLYSPLGVEFGRELNAGWDVKLIAEYDIFWSGEQKSHLDDVSPRFTTISNDQNDGYGLRASAQFRKKGQRYDIVIEPFIRWWDIEDSERSNLTASGVIVGYAYEPQNETLEAGAKISFIY